MRWCAVGATHLISKVSTGSSSVKASIALHRTSSAVSEGNAVSDVATKRIVLAVERVRKADAAAASARQALRTLMRGEVEAGRTTKSEIARALGVSRQRVQQMLDGR